MATSRGIPPTPEPASIYDFALYMQCIDIYIVHLVPELLLRLEHVCLADLCSHLARPYIANVDPLVLVQCDRAPVLDDLDLHQG